MARSNSAPAGHEFFEQAPPDDAAPPSPPPPPPSSPFLLHSPILVQQAHTKIQNMFQRPDSASSRYYKKRGSYHSTDTSSDNDTTATDNKLVAVKIFSKSVLKRKRTMERDRETRKTVVKTALEKVEREIALDEETGAPESGGILRGDRFARLGYDVFGKCTVMSSLLVCTFVGVGVSCRL